jgi:hypothetical protein
MEVAVWWLHIQSGPSYVSVSCMLVGCERYIKYYYFKYVVHVHWDSSVGIATRYGLDGSGLESRWETRFFAPIQTGPGAHPASCMVGTGSFLGVKWPGHGVDHPPSSSTEVKERVELYL